MVASTNFGFLSAHDRNLVALRGLAESYFRANPSTFLFKLRQFAKLLAKLIAAHHATYSSERESFEQTLRRLFCNQLLPRDVADLFHHLRKVGSTAAHEATLLLR